MNACLSTAKAKEGKMGAVSNRRSLILVPVPDEPSWMDYVFLAAVPATFALNKGKTAVSAIEPNVPYQRELQDFILRFKPDQLFLISDTAEKKDKDFSILFKDVEKISVTSSQQAANMLAWKFWKKSEFIVICREDKYGKSLAASALAARLKCPLLFYGDKGLNQESRKSIKKLACKTIINVGYQKIKLPGFDITTLKNSHDIIKWMVAKKMQVNYLAAVNPKDRLNTKVKKISLAAPMLAAGREGVVALLDFKTQWKIPYKVSKTYKKKLKNFPPSKAGWKKGTITLNKKEYTFVLTGDKKDTFDKVSIAQGKRGKFMGPFHTADVLKLGRREYIVNLNPKDGVGKADLRLTWPGTDELKSRLDTYYRTLGQHPEDLCLFGWPDAIPQAIVRKNMHEPESDIPCDLPYAQFGERPFLDIAVGRFVTENLWSATLLAARSLNYEELIDDSWAGNLGTACWENLYEKDFKNIGFFPRVHHDGKSLLKNSSPLCDTAAIVHREHSSWQNIGNFFKWQDETILAPSVIDTGGCSTMTLDVQNDNYSAPARLLRNGAVCVSGNTRLGIGEQEHYRSEWWSAIFMGKSVGQAHLYALNRVLLAVLDKDQLEQGPDRYQFYNRILFGDPAITMHRPSKPLSSPACFEKSGSEITVYGPSKWWKYNQHIVSDWNYKKTKKLYAYHGFGVGREKEWCGKDHYGKVKHYYVVELRTCEKIKGIEQITKTPDTLGWNGKFWTQEHQDGSCSIFWRIRMIDIDMPNGKILKKIDKVKFRLIKKENRRKL